MSFKLNVNGRTTTVDAPPDMPLLWVLRDVLDLKGSKYGCGIGQCGACTVHFKGSPVRSCILPVSRAAEGPILTIEGLSTDGSHPLQKAWNELDVPQCGYCQAGQIMTAAALLASKPQPFGRRHRRRHDGQPLPVRHLPAHPRGDPQGGRPRRRRHADEVREAPWTP